MDNIWIIIWCIRYKYIYIEMELSGDRPDRPVEEFLTFFFGESFVPRRAKRRMKRSELNFCSCVSGLIQRSCETYHPSNPRLSLKLFGATSRWSWLADLWKKLWHLWHCLLLTICIVCQSAHGFDGSGSHFRLHGPTDCDAETESAALLRRRKDACETSRAWLLLAAQRMEMHILQAPGHSSWNTYINKLENIL